MSDEFYDMTCQALFLVFRRVDWDMRSVCINVAYKVTDSHDGMMAGGRPDRADSLERVQKVTKREFAKRVDFPGLGQLIDIGVRNEWFSIIVECWSEFAQPFPVIDDVSSRNYDKISTRLSKFKCMLTTYLQSKTLDEQQRFPRLVLRLLGLR